MEAGEGWDLAKSRGPAKDAPIAPKGAVMRIERTAMVNTSAPRPRSATSGVVAFLAVSRACEANAAWETDIKTSFNLINHHFKPSKYGMKPDVQSINQCVPDI